MPIKMPSPPNPSNPPNPPSLPSLSHPPNPRFKHSRFYCALRLKFQNTMPLLFHLTRKILGAFVVIYWNLSSSFYFLFRIFGYKIVAEFNMFEKSRKHAKTKTVFEKKRICDAIVVSFMLLLRVTKVS